MPNLGGTQVGFDYRCRMVGWWSFWLWENLKEEGNILSCKYQERCRICTRNHIAAHDTPPKWSNGQWIRLSSVSYTEQIVRLLASQWKHRIFLQLASPATGNHPASQLQFHLKDWWWILASPPQYTTNKDAKWPSFLQSKWYGLR